MQKSLRSRTPEYLKTKEATGAGKGRELGMRSERQEGPAYVGPLEAIVTTLGFSIHEMRNYGRILSR